MISPPDSLLSDTGLSSGAFAQWRRSRGPDAFRQVVAAHLPWVLATARRRLEAGGESHAEDVAQQVFLDLVRHTSKVRPENLGGWLHRHTVFCAAKAMRAQRRRAAREQAGGQLMNESITDAPEESAWREMAPLLDASLDELPAPDREALLLRFFQSLPLAAVGETLGTSTAAAQKRVERALDRLRAALQRRGVTGTCAGLGAVLLIHAKGEARAAMAEKIASTALSPAVGTAGGFPWGLATAASVILSAGVAGWAGASSSPPIPHSFAGGAASAPLVEDGKDRDARLAATLAMLEKTGREGLSALRSLRLAAVLKDMPTDELALLGPYALAHSQDPAVRRAVVARWAVTDFSAAWKTAASAPALEPAVFSQGLTALAEQSPQGAADFFKTLPSPDQRQLAAAILEGLGQSRPDLGRRIITELAASVSPVEIRDLLLPFYASWARRDPAAAAQSAAQGDSALNRRGRPDGPAFAAVINQWASRDPAAAAAFLSNQPPGENRSRAYGTTLSHLVRARPESLGNWLAAMPADELPAPGTRAAALASPNFLQLVVAAEVWSRDHLTEAQALAASTGNGVLRRALWCGIASALAPVNPVEASRLADAQSESVLVDAMRGIIAKKSPLTVP
ncbi:MAG: sigma-70 family RNA polymerase sigma factor [Verrucomicrobiota bacterium]